MTNTSCEFVWYELVTSDGPAAEAFYRAVVGWTVQDAGMPGMRHAVASVGSTPVGGMMRRADGGTSASWLYYIHVAQIDAAVDRVRAHGGQVQQAPMEVPGNMWIVQCTDPQGAFFALLGAR
jgi:hypothetical protein